MTGFDGRIFGRRFSHQPSAAMTRLQNSLKWIQDNSDVLFDVVRIYIGLGLAVRGFFALVDPTYFGSWLSDLGVTGGAAAAARGYIILAHLGGGILMAIGYLTRIAALAQLPVLIGAVFFIHFPEGLAGPDQSLEFSALVLFLVALFAVRGSGRLSVMSYLRRKRLAESNQ